MLKGEDIKRKVPIHFQSLQEDCFLVGQSTTAEDHPSVKIQTQMSKTMKSCILSHRQVIHLTLSNSLHTVLACCSVNSEQPGTSMKLRVGCWECFSYNNNSFN